MSLTDLTIAGARDGLRARQFTARELTEAHLAAITALNPRLNAYITVTGERALAQADAADAALARGEFAPLTGIPLAIKDLFCTEGVRTTAGSRILDPFIPPYESTVSANLLRDGAVFLGKSNMDEFAMGSSNMTSAYGAVTNPWQRRQDQTAALVPGGSSGGSAAAVSARLALGATGTDTGGSIRQPASFCGVVGVKPTYGRCSRFGLVAFASSLDTPGVFARTAEDCGLLLNAMAGHDARDSTSVDAPVPDYVAALAQPLKGLRIGLLREFFDKGLEPPVEKCVRAAIEALREQGATVQEVSLPHLPLSVPTYYVVAPAECSSNLSRFDGVRFGYRCDDPRDLLDLYKRSRGEGFGAEVKRRIMTGTYVLSAGYYDAYYLKAQQVRRLITADFNRAFAEVDVVLGPTAPTAAFELGAKTSDPIKMYLNDIYTIGANLAGLPAVSIPCGFVDEEGVALPVGLQLIGPHFAEARLLSVAHHYQRLTDWHSRVPPGYE